MPKFKVIKAHDGIPVGTIKSLPDSPLTAYMVDNGWWVKVEEAEQPKTTTRKRTRSSK